MGRRTTVELVDGGPDASCDVCLVVDEVLTNDARLSQVGYDVRLERKKARQPDGRGQRHGFCIQGRTKLVDNKNGDFL